MERNKAIEIYCRLKHFKCYKGENLYVDPLTGKTYSKFINAQDKKPDVEEIDVRTWEKELDTYEEAMKDINFNSK